MCKFFGNKFINNLQKLSKTKSQIAHLQPFTIFTMLKSFPKQKTTLSTLFSFLFHFSIAQKA